MCPRGRFRASGVKFLSMSLTPGACEAVPAYSSGRSSRQTDITRSKPWSGCGGLTGSTSLKYSEPGDRQMFDGMPLQRVAALAPPLWARSDGRRASWRARFHGPRGWGGVPCRPLYRFWAAGSAGKQLQQPAGRRRKVESGRSAPILSTGLDRGAYYLVYNLSPA